MRLANKTAIVTGAGAGIGKASAELFGAEGARVLCVDIAPDLAEATAGEITRAGGAAKVFRADVTQASDTQAMVDTAIQEFGHLDILFNNAGGSSRRAPVHELTEDEWDFTLALTLKSAFLGSKAAIPHFLAQGHGVIINTSSTFGILATPRNPSYCAAKAGVLLLTKQMALDYGPTIRVNCICPGATDTPHMRDNIAQSGDPDAYIQRLSFLNRAAGRMAEPKEIAYAALFLASDEASFVTGHHLVVDGGQTIDA